MKYLRAVLASIFTVRVFKLMQVSKLTPQDIETLAEHKRIKAPLGVIHPVHSKVDKDEDDEDFSDLVITAKPLKPGQRSASKPELPAHLVTPVMKTKTPKKAVVKPPWGRRASPKKSGKIKTMKQERELKNVSLNILRAIPEFVSTLTQKKKLSLLRGKDLTTSTREYKQKLANLVKGNKEKERTKIADGQDEAHRLMSEKFSQLKMTEEEYIKTRAEVEELRRLYDQQIWKEKIISRFLNEHTEGDLNIRALKRLLSQKQLRQEHTFLAMQKFVLNLKEYVMHKDHLTYVVGVQMSDLSSFLRSYTPGLSEPEREHVIYFIEQVKLSITDSRVDSLSIKAIEETLERLFLTWDQEKTMIEAFIDDCHQAICYEQKIDLDTVLSHDRPKSAQQLELRIVAEFISQYFDRLTDSMKKKAMTLEKIIYRLRYGKEMPGQWSNLINIAKEQVKASNKTSNATQVTGNPRPESAKTQTPGRNLEESKGPARRPESAKPTPQGPTPQGPTPQGPTPQGNPSSQGKPQISFMGVLGANLQTGAAAKQQTTPTSKQPSAPPAKQTPAPTRQAHEPTKQTLIPTRRPAETALHSPAPSKQPVSNLAVSHRNPLDSLTSLNDSLDKDLDEFISVLNAKKPSSNSSSPRVPSRQTPEPARPTGILKTTHQPLSTIPSSVSPKRSNSPESRPQSRYKKLEEQIKQFSPFASIDGPLRESSSERIQTYKDRLARLEEEIKVRSQVDDQGVRLSRSELLKAGAVKFSPYLDAEGKSFDPADKFKHMEKPRARESDIDPLYLFEMTQKKPEREEDWFVRPHHLQSVTKHPYSINDDPLVVRKKDLPSTIRPSPSKEDGIRETAVSHLEGAIEDLKCELEERKRALRTKVYTTEEDVQEPRYVGWVAKAAETFT
mmetsp:Transcript_6295/g.10918  ORF Transcript_6295/g.10918 Transcript_6295/m.10918 type:complete len:899 (-) Transcript_6295:287-2983(-)